jgi:hypothetical protein
MRVNAISVTVMPSATVMVLSAAGVVALAIAVVNERRMQRHRQPGVSYWDVTLRRDGAWRRADLFTDTGLALQRRAAKWGIIGTVLLAEALIVLALIGILWSPYRVGSLDPWSHDGVVGQGRRVAGAS